MSKHKPNPIRLARQRTNRTQQDLGNAIGVTKATISRWETNTDLPDPANAKRLIEQLPGLTFDQIYARAA